MQKIQPGTSSMVVYPMMGLSGHSASSILETLFSRAWGGFRGWTSSNRMALGTGVVIGAAALGLGVYFYHKMNGNGRAVQKEAEGLTQQVESVRKQQQTQNGAVDSMSQLTRGTTAVLQNAMDSQRQAQEKAQEAAKTSSSSEEESSSSETSTIAVLGRIQQANQSSYSALSKI